MNQETEVITSRANPKVKTIVRLAQHKQRRNSGLFVIESMRDLDRAITVGLKVREIYICPDVFGQTLEQLRSLMDVEVGESIRWFEVNDSVLEKMTYRENPEGIVAVLEQNKLDLANMSKGKAKAGKDELWAVTVGMEKPGNVGAIARTLGAAGGTGMLLADAKTDAMNPNAIRASTGAVFDIPCIETTSQDAIDFLQKRGVKFIVADPNADKPYTDADLTGPVAVVLGAEDSGVPQIWKFASKSKTKGQMVSIPMKKGVVDSLNASISAAVVIYEAMRQRAAKK